MNPEYSTMVAGSFLKVGAAKQFTLGDITVAYGDEDSIYPRGPWWNSEDDEWADCCDGSIRLKVLTSTGGDGGTYAWMDTVTDSGDPDADRVGPGWAHYDTTVGEMLTPEELRSAACTFNIGQAFWIEGGGARLQSAGAVTDQDIEFETAHEYSTAVGNGTAADWTLGEVAFLYGDEESMYPRGPWWNSDDDEWADCCDGSLRLKRLTSTGGDGGTYAWMDTVTDSGDPDADRVGPGWAFYDTTVGEMLTPEELAAVKVKAGDGFWVEGGGAKLRFINAITPTKDAE